MKKIEKIIKFLMIVFIVCLVFIFIDIRKNLDLNQNFYNVFMIVFLVTLVLLLSLLIILSFKSMYKYFKKNKPAFFKALIFRFVFLLLMDLGIDFMRGQGIDLIYSLIYSSLISVGSFYIEDKFWN